MRWQIEGFVFCDQQQLLISDDKEQQLEPILVELLAYFCRHPTTIISRDELIEQVWLGRTVSDSAVNRAITKLRKCLCDNAKAPRYIATFPKKGYKFIANVEQIQKLSYLKTHSAKDDVPAIAKLGDSHPRTTSRDSSNKTNRVFVSASIAIIFALVLWDVYLSLDSTQTTSQLISQATPLTRSAGQEWQPRISPDLKYLAFTEVLNNKMHLYVKRLSSGEILEINPLAANSNEYKEAWIGPASWNNKGDKLVYLVASQNFCRYYVQTFSEMQLGSPELLHNCPAGSFGKITFTHSDDLLVFAERPNSDKPYEIFTLDLSTQKKQKVKQPPAMLGGNMMFDLHPTKNKLLISSVDSQMWEAFYELDLDSKKLELLFKLDAYTCCGIWDHTGGRVILMGEHPAVQLVSYDLNGNDKQIIYAGSHQLYAPERHPNGRDYVFPAGAGNLDIHLFNLSTQETIPIVNSSVDDRLVVVSPQEDKLAYIGLASGKEELWLVDIASGHQRKIPLYNEERHYRDLSWSPDGKHIAGLTLNEIYLFDTYDNTEYQLKIPQTELKAISFKDEHTLFFSMKQNDRWQLQSYDLVTDTVSKQDEKWRFVRFAPAPQSSIWVDQDFNLFEGTTPTLVASPVVDTASIINGANINIRKQGDNWYWLQWHTDQYHLYQKSNQSDDANKLVTSNSPHFDIFSGGIVFHRAKYKNTDIFQTLSTN